MLLEKIPSFVSVSIRWRRWGLGQAVFERPNELFHAVTCTLSLPRPYGSSGDLIFPPSRIALGVRYLTGGSDVGYILSAGRADVKQLRELNL